MALVVVGSNPTVHTLYMKNRNQYHELLKNYSLGVEIGVEFGELPEWLKERFAKPWSGNWPVGSNPTLSAIF